MDLREIQTFGNISQRVAATLIKSLAEYHFVPLEGLTPGEQSALEASQKQLHEFFSLLYDEIYSSPGSFGLPETEDVFLVEGEQRPKDWKQIVTRKLEKPRNMIEQGVDFLLGAGQVGKLDGSCLVFDEQDFTGLVRQSKVKKPFLAGLESSGLEMTGAAGKKVLSSTDFPRMMPALQALATACAGYTDAKLGKFNFARCDFRALEKDWHPASLDLYRVFSAADFERLSRLHEYFTAKNYKPVYQFNAFGWDVEYQGNRQIKATPFLHIEYAERYRPQLRVGVKTASAARILPLLAGQPRTLQEDFFRRANTCANCGWCKNRKTLGPSVIELDGQIRTICWYVGSEIHNFDEGAIELVKQYERMHEQLA